MPRFHFPIVNGHRLEDPVGVDLPDKNAARKHARTIAKYVAEVGNQTTRHVIAEDENGDEVGNAVVKKD